MCSVSRSRRSLLPFPFTCLQSAIRRSWVHQRTQPDWEEWRSGSVDPVWQLVAMCSWGLTFVVCVVQAIGVCFDWFSILYCDLVIVSLLLFLFETEQPLPLEEACFLLPDNKIYFCFYIQPLFLSCLNPSNITVTPLIALDTFWGRNKHQELSSVSTICVWANSNIACISAQDKRQTKTYMKPWQQHRVFSTD